MMDKKLQIKCFLQIHLQEVKERDEEITRLSQQLAEATQEIESSAVIINKLKKSRV